MKDHFLPTPAYQSKSTQEIIKSFESLTQNSWENVFDPAEKDAYHRFLTFAIQSDTIQDLENKSAFLFRKSIQPKFFSTLRSFEPVFTSTVWNSYGSELQTYTQEIQTLYAKHDSLLDSISAFYGSVDIAPTLWVGFYPIVQKDGSIFAENMGEAQSVGILMGNKNQLDRMGAVLHEFSHYLFRNQSKEMKTIRNETFRKSLSKDKSFSYAYVDEMLATVCGNGWAIEKINGKNDDPVWYSDDTIEKFSRAVYPSAKTYLDLRKSADENFYAQAIQSFTQTFPDFTKNKTVSMMDVIAFIDDGIVPHYVVNASLRSMFDSRQMVFISPFDAPQTKTKLSENPNSTRVYVLSQNSIPRAKTFFTNIPELASISSKIKFKSGTSRIFQNSDHVYVVILYANNRDEYKQALNDLKRKS